MGPRGAAKTQSAAGNPAAAAVRRSDILVAFQDRDLCHHVPPDGRGRVAQVSAGPRDLGENPQGSFRMRHYAKMFGIRLVLR